MDDDNIIQKAFNEEWILITNDKGFGEKVYRRRQPHRGVVLLRLDDERPSVKIATLELLLLRYSDRVATEKRVRFART
jgi:predicted nuclease of predicted toxin-antitoxin system